MSETINYNPNEQTNEPIFKNFRLSISDDVLVTAIEEYQRKTGMSERELCREAIVSYLEEQEQIKLQ
jgi:hypothetical protein